MTNWNERARELLIKEEGKDIGNAGIAYLCYGIEESIQRVAKELEAAYLTGVRDENEACKRATCKYCDLQRPLIGDTHTWQVLTGKDKKGKYIYNPVQEECLAKAIRSRIGKKEESGG